MRSFPKPYLPILIVLASLLSATPNGTAQNQSPTPTANSKTPLTQKGDQSPKAAQAKSISLIASPVIEPSKPTAKGSEPQNGSAEIQYSQQKQLNKFDWVSIWNGIQTPLQILFTLATTVATVYLAIFTYRLVAVTKDMHIATSATAEIAKLSLDADRPYLLVEKGGLRGFDGIKEISEASFIFKNFGKRPPIITRIVLRLDHVQVGKYPAKRDFSKCVEKASTVYAVGAGETFQTKTDATHSFDEPLDMEDIRQGKRALICYGCLYYADPMDDETAHETGFLWYYHPHPPDFLKLCEMIGQPRKYKGRFLPARGFYYHT